MRLSAYQPQYFPRLHYFARLLASDIFTISDTFQFVKAHRYPTADGGHQRGKSYQADTPIKASLALQYLTVPIAHGGLLPINQTRVAYHLPWQKKHLKGIAVNYASARNFSVVFPHLTELLQRPYAHVAQLNTTTMLWALGWILTGGQWRPNDSTLSAINQRLAQPHPFRLRTIAQRAAVKVPSRQAGDDATDVIITTCRFFSADEYYGGGTAVAAYLDVARLQRAGIALVEQHWVCQPYRQLFPQQGFIPNLSIIDLLMNEDHERVQHLLQGGAG